MGYTNHSCPPKIRFEEWWASGYLHTGIFTIEDAESSSEVTVDYGWMFRDGNYTLCHCSSEMCRGIIEKDVHIVIECRENSTTPDNPTFCVTLNGV